MAYSFYVYAFDFADADRVVREVDTMDIGERNSVVFQANGWVKVIFHYKNCKGREGKSMIKGLNLARYRAATVQIQLEDRIEYLHWCRVPTSKKTRKN